MARRYRNLVDDRWMIDADKATEIIEKKLYDYAYAEYDGIYAPDYFTDTWLDSLTGEISAIIELGKALKLLSKTRINNILDKAQKDAKKYHEQD